MSVIVADVMTREVWTLSPEMTLTEMDRLFVERRLSGAPVVEQGRLLGVASRADVIRALLHEQQQAERVSAAYTSPFLLAIPTLERLAKDSRAITERMIKLRVREIMTKDAKTVRPTEDVQRAARLMVAEGFHRLPVVEEGRLVGIITSTDIARLVAERGLAAR
jgi:CBS domain-containing protein